MKANQDKCHFLPSLKISSKFCLPAYILEKSGSQKFLGVTNEKTLNFRDHVTNPCDKESRKIQTSAKFF